MKHLNTLFLLALAMLLTACVTSPTGRTQLMLVSERQAISASREAYVKTLQPLHDQGKVDTNPKTTQRIKIITGRLITQAVEQFPNTRNWQWSIKVIDDPELVNAWCMAGGKMAIYTGLIDKLKATDDELAQVIGHEISHAIANHTAEKMSMAMATQIGMAGLSVAVKDSEYAQEAMSGAALAASLAVSLPNSRVAETESDQMGIELAARAGYNPQAAVTLWAKMGQNNGASPPEFLSTHPSAGSRQARLQKLVPKVMPLYREKKTHPVYPLN